MMTASGHWDDLLPRILSALALAGVALFAVWVGGTVFHIFVGLLVGVMVWELARMFEAASPVLIALGAGLLSLAVAEMRAPSLLAPTVLSVFAMPLSTRMRMAVAAALLAILTAGYGVAHLRTEQGMTWMIWFALV
ncbi:MAG: phosphatidate cytidylyltransferase, partial [Pseudomonadota bacterium]